MSDTSATQKRSAQEPLTRGEKKLKKCPYLLTEKGCRFGAECHYLHPDTAVIRDEKIRPYTLTREMKSVRICPFLPTKKGCRFGDECHYIHPEKGESGTAPGFENDEARRAQEERMEMEIIESHKNIYDLEDHVEEQDAEIDHLNAQNDELKAALESAIQDHDVALNTIKHFDQLLRAEQRTTRNLNDFAQALKYNIRAQAELLKAYGDDNLRMAEEKKEDELGVNERFYQMLQRMKAVEYRQRVYKSMMEKYRKDLDRSLQREREAIKMELTWPEHLDQDDEHEEIGEDNESANGWN